MNNGTLKSNFNDEDVLTWELKGDTLTFYENGKIDDIVYLQIINENKIIIKDETTDTEGMPFIRTTPNPYKHFLNKFCGGGEVIPLITHTGKEGTIAVYPSPLDFFTK